jgi:hypothetical protein
MTQYGCRIVRRKAPQQLLWTLLSKRSAAGGNRRTGLSGPPAVLGVAIAVGVAIAATAQEPCSEYLRGRSQTSSTTVAPRGFLQKNLTLYSLLWGAFRAARTS